MTRDLVCMCVCGSWKNGHKFYYPRPKYAVLVGGSTQAAEGWGVVVCSCAAVWTPTVAGMGGLSVN